MPDTKQIILFIQAFRIGLKAQQIEKVSLTQLISELTNSRWLPQNLAPADAHLAASRALRYLKRLGYRTSCIIECLIVGTLLSDQVGIRIHLGFRPLSGNGFEDADGHAWLSGACYPQDVNSESYQETTSLPIKRKHHV